MNETQGEETVNAALARARAHSPFLKLQLANFPEIADALGRADLVEAMTLARAAGAAAPNVAASLRRERSALAAVLAIGDLAGATPLETLMETLSDLADRSIESALAAAMSERIPHA